LKYVFDTISAKKYNLIVLILFVLFSIVLTYPLAFHMDTGLEIGDPALNAWILAWDVHSILTDPLNIFNTNVFYPFTHNNLAFSEDLFADMLVAFPIIVITKNVILAYNTIFILSFVLSGFGVFLLVDYYLKDKYSAFLAGFAFAFCAFRFSHIGHLQLLTIELIPISILYFDKFIKVNNYKNLSLFYIFYFLQILSCWYYAFYLTFLLGLLIIYNFVINGDFRRKVFDRSFQLKVALLLTLLVVTLAPIAAPYIEIANEYGAARSLAEVSSNSGDVADYLFAPPFNMIYGKIYPPSGRAWWEHSLFPGVSVTILGFYGLLSINNKRNFYLRYMGGSTQNFYLILAFFAFVLSLGTQLHFFGHVMNINLPYNYFYEYIPGFKSMRAPVRWGVMVTFSLSILAGYGLNKLINHKSNAKRFTIFLLCILLILLESIYVPLGYGTAPLGKNIPEVYNWLSNETSDFAIVELPMIYVDQIQSGIDLYKNTKYMYYSTYHWKKLVNGYSGFTPENYIKIVNTIKSFPSNESIELLHSLGIKYVIVHKDDIDLTTWNHINKSIEKYKNKDVKSIKTFNQDYVYEMN